ncbi:hypothetical protein FNV43_RR13057 [Rhamnella rubrinervis]|uniref:Uncharacterized protein n=1 Tax=Rhamnella rubrinervis TaxID=2594499 RepID=A0A8K0MEK5_9ROSA|nr:hypothetical protein FNV43_RR13057 [Rhamnella rubrinervis]
MKRPYETVQGISFELEVLKKESDDSILLGYSIIRRVVGRKFLGYNLIELDQLATEVGNKPAASPSGVGPSEGVQEAAQSEEVSSPSKGKIGPQPQGELDLERLILGSGNTRPEEENLNSESDKPEEEETRLRKNSTWRGKTQPEEEETRPRENSTCGGMHSTQGKLNLERKNLDPGKAQPGEEESLLRENSTWGGRNSTQRELNLGRKILDSGRVRPEEILRCSAFQRCGSGVSSMSTSSYVPGTSSATSFVIGSKLLTRSRFKFSCFVLLESRRYEGDKMLLSFLYQDG